MQAMLLYVPITDATAPYHSLVYLASYARHAGFHDVHIRDTNIEALSFCARSDALQKTHERCGKRFRELSSLAGLDGIQQLEYQRLAREQAIVPGNIPDAIALLRDPDRFYDYRAYRTAVRRITCWSECLSCDAIPGQFDTGGQSLRRFGCVSLSSIADLTNQSLLERIVGPFVPYCEERFIPELASDLPRVIGINITYTSQLPYALWLLRRLRKEFPDAFIVCGGTEVSGTWKYMRDRKHMAEIFADADACVIGEGETAFVRILDAVLGGKAVGPVPNVVTIDRAHKIALEPAAIVYENLETLPTPEFQLMQSELYFSPYPLVCYAPTRGCYWNKCTFCDYGLNFGTPTSPWRQLSLERCVDDLRRISAYSRHVYLSVDVLAPARLTELARSIVEAGINIEWSAEIRLEPFFTLERVRVLRQSGCVSVSVGFEAGTQRILDLIDKGVDLGNVEEIIRTFSDAGIAVQMMGFTGFPTETHAEAMASIEFLRQTRRWWSVSGMGTFMLTPGSILACKPIDGMSNVRVFQGDDICRTLYYEDADGNAASGDDDAMRTIKHQLVDAEFDRPYAGGIDTAHSLFYYGRYGRAFPRDICRETQAWEYDPDARPLFNGSLIEDCRNNPLRAKAEWRIRDAHNHAASQGIALDYAAIVQVLEQITPLEADEFGKCYIARDDGAILPCPPTVRDFLRAADGSRTFAELETLAAASGRSLEEASMYATALGNVLSHEARGTDAPGASAVRDLAMALVKAELLVVDRDTSPVPLGIHVDCQPARALTP